MATLLEPADAIARARTMNIDGDPMTAEEFFEVFFIAAPDQLIPRFLENIDTDAPIMVDAVTLEWLGYTGTLHDNQQQFIGRLDELDVPHEVIDEDAAVMLWPEVATDIADVDPQHREELRWVVLSGLNFKLACLSARTENAALLVARFYVEVEMVFRAYTAYCARVRERQRDDDANQRVQDLVMHLNQLRLVLDEVEHDRDVLDEQRQAMAERYVPPPAEVDREEVLEIIEMAADYVHDPESDPAYTNGITHVFVRRQRATLERRLEVVRQWGNGSNRNAVSVHTIETPNACQLFIAFRHLAADERVVRMRSYGCTLDANGAAAVINLLNEAAAARYNGL